MKDDIAVLRDSLAQTIKNDNIMREILESVYSILEFDANLISKRKIYRDNNLVSHESAARSVLIYNSMNIDYEEMDYPVTFAEHISEYFIHYCSYDALSISKDLEEIPLIEYSHLNETDSTALTYGDFNAVRLVLHVDHSSHRLKEILFYTATNILYKKLGIKNSFIILEELLRLFKIGEFHSEDGLFMEILVEAANYCEKNSDYPIEWLIDNAFSSKNGVRED